MALTRISNARIDREATVREHHHETSSLFTFLCAFNIRSKTTFVAHIRGIKTIFRFDPRQIFLLGDVRQKQQLWLTSSSDDDILPNPYASPPWMFWRQWARAWILAWPVYYQRDCLHWSPEPQSNLCSGLRTVFNLHWKQAREGEWLNSKV